MKPIRPTAVIDTEHSHSAARNSASITGHSARPRAWAASPPSCSRLSGRGARTSTGSASSNLGHSHCTQCQSICARSPAPQTNRPWVYWLLISTSPAASAPSSRFISMPPSTSGRPPIPLRPAISSTRPTATRAPPRAAHCPCSAAKAGSSSVARTSPSQAPDEAPMVIGDTRRFCVICCNRLPDRPSAAPVSNAMLSLGNADSCSWRNAKLCAGAPSSAHSSSGATSAASHRCTSISGSSASSVRTWRAGAETAATFRPPRQSCGRRRAARSVRCRCRRAG